MPGRLEVQRGHLAAWPGKRHLPAASAANRVGLSHQAEVRGADGDAAAFRIAAYVLETETTYAWGAWK